VELPGQPFVGIEVRERGGEVLVEVGLGGRSGHHEGAGSGLFKGRTTAQAAGVAPMVGREPEEAGGKGGSTAETGQAGPP
jgi:hypothetical protein